MRDWVTNVRTTHYLLGSVLGAHPYPTMVRDFHRVIGREARAQILKAEGKLPDGDHRLRRRRLECHRHLLRFHQGQESPADRRRSRRPRRHSRRPCRPLSGRLSRRAAGNLFVRAAGRRRTDCATHSVSAGLDYPSIGPEHAWLKDTGRAEYVSASDAEALEACTVLARTEGIIPALESAHAVAEAIKRAPKMKKSEIVIVNISGRGDKDIGILRENLKLD